jgi:hypothetical protein
MEKFGWSSEEGDGIMAAGGSMSNFYGMVRLSNLFSWSQSYDLELQRN